jgi:hypothetical protein
MRVFPLLPHPPLPERGFDRVLRRATVVHAAGPAHGPLRSQAPGMQRCVQGAGLERLAVHCFGFKLRLPLEYESVFLSRFPGPHSDAADGRLGGQEVPQERVDQELPSRTYVWVRGGSADCDAGRCVPFTIRSIQSFPVLPHAQESGHPVGAYCTENQSEMTPKLLGVRHFSTFCMSNGSHSHRVTVTPERAMVRGADVARTPHAVIGKHKHNLPFYKCDRDIIPDDGVCVPWPGAGAGAGLVCRAGSALRSIPGKGNTWQLHVSVCSAAAVREARVCDPPALQPRACRGAESQGYVVGVLQPPLLACCTSLGALGAAGARVCHDLAWVGWM